MIKSKKLKKHHVQKKSKKTSKTVKNRESKKVPTIIPVLVKKTQERKKSKRTFKINPNKMYFNEDTEQAIIEYNKTEDQDKRNDLYNNRIKYAFEKLVESIFNKFKFSYFETGPIDVQRETVAHLVANMDKYDPNRVSKLHPKMKTKAYSYFSIVAKNYLIFVNNTNHTRFNRHSEIGEDREEHTIQLQSEDNHQKEVETAEFLKLMVEFWENNLTKIFTKMRDLNIANAVIELFRNSDRIDAFNKKALYLYIREISSCKTQQITKVINKMRQYQQNIMKSYMNNGVVNTSSTFSTSNLTV